uniref:Phosphatidylinositol-glycan biosynthesis class S protein n=1 Tax=Hirondellea gigas TaxID=1518452 RepID=A0A6A7GBU1_9CRUS
MPSATPPPQPPRSTTSLCVLFSFSLAGLLCVPLWWSTSKVIRETLPQIGQLQLHSWPLSIEVYLPPSISSERDFDRIRQSLLQSLKRTKRNVAIQFHSFEPKFQNSVRTVEELDEELTTVLSRSDSPSETSGKLEFFVFQHSESHFQKIRSKKWHFGQYRHGWFISDESDAFSDSVWEDLGELLSSKLLFTPKKSDDRLAFETEVTLSFTLLNSDPSERSFLWDFEGAFQLFLRPFLSKLNDVFVWSVDSQILHFGKISSSKVLSSEKGFYLTPKSLESFVGSTNWNVVSTRSTSPAIEFLAFVPPASQTPLYIRDRSKKFIGTSFTVPRWGGVTIWNPSSKSSNQSASDQKQSRNYSPELMSVKEIQSIMEIFLQQMRDMLGLPSIAPSNENDRFYLSTSPIDGLTDWERDGLLIDRIRTNLFDAHSTLNSLYDLAESVPHLPIEKHIQDYVVQSVYSAEMAESLCKDGKFALCLRHSRESRKSAHNAFFDPKMLPALYFSDEFTFAVYLPFFLPAFVPIITVISKQVKLFFKRRASLSINQN